MSPPRTKQARRDMTQRCAIRRHRGDPPMSRVFRKLTSAPPFTWTAQPHGGGLIARLPGTGRDRYVELIHKSYEVEDAIRHGVSPRSAGRWAANTPFCIVGPFRTRRKAQSAIRDLFADGDPAWLPTPYGSVGHADMLSHFTISRGRGVIRGVAWTPPRGWRGRVEYDLLEHGTTTIVHGAVVAIRVRGFSAKVFVCKTMSEAHAWVRKEGKAC